MRASAQRNTHPITSDLRRRYGDERRIRLREGIHSRMEHLRFPLDRVLPCPVRMRFAPLAQIWIRAGDDGKAQASSSEASQMHLLLPGLGEAETRLGVSSQ
jgi:hypothetical protein